MRLLKPFVISAAMAAAIFIVSCRKDTSSTTSHQPADNTCVTGRGVSSGDIVPGQYIVSLKSSGGGNARVMSTTQVDDIGTRLMKTHAIKEGRMEKSFPGLHGGFVAHLSKEEVEKLKTDESVDMVEPDRIVALGSCFKVVEPSLITWSVKRVGYGDGTGKTAWVIDSGIDFDHPDLNVDVTRSKSFLANNTSPRDENGHGTHVAGIIGAKNNSIGILGVASGASLVSLRVLDASGDGLLSSIIQALAYVNANGKAGDVVNMSLGEDIASPTLDQQVQYTASKGIYIAIAAGNDSKPAINFSPGRANGPNIYTVSAIDSLDNFASFSNYGNDAVDVAAPGVAVTSTYLNGQYAIMSGTSMATPHVAGLLLLKGNSITHSGTAKNDPDGTPDPIAHY